MQRDTLVALHDTGIHTLHASYHTRCLRAHETAVITRRPHSSPYRQHSPQPDHGRERRVETWRYRERRNTRQKRKETQSRLAGTL